MDVFPAIELNILGVYILSKYDANTLLSVLGAFTIFRYILL